MVDGKKVDWCPAGTDVPDVRACWPRYKDDGQVPIVPTVEVCPRKCVQLKEKCEIVDTPLEDGIENGWGNTRPTCRCTSAACDYLGKCTIKESCCFPASASVMLADSSEVSITELQHGHRLASVDVSNSGVANSEVSQTDFVWEQHQFDMDAVTRVLSYRVISHSLMKKPLSISGDHMLMVSLGCQGESSAIPARQVKIGDCLLALANANSAGETSGYAASQVTGIMM